MANIVINPPRRFTTWTIYLNRPVPYSRTYEWLLILMMKNSWLCYIVTNVISYKALFVVFQDLCMAVEVLAKPLHNLVHSAVHPLGPPCPSDLLAQVSVTNDQDWIKDETRPGVSLSALRRASVLEGDLHQLRRMLEQGNKVAVFCLVDRWCMTFAM